MRKLLICITKKGKQNWGQSKACCKHRSWTEQHTKCVVNVT